MAFTAQSMSKFVAIFHGCFCLYRGIDQKYSLSKLELYKHDFVNTRGADGSCLNDRIQEVSGYWIGHRLLNDVYQIFMLSLQFWMVLSNSFFCMHVIICMHYACVLNVFLVDFSRAFSQYPILVSLTLYKKECFCFAL